MASNIWQALLNGKTITVLVDLQPKDPFLILGIMSNVKHGELRCTMHWMKRRAPVHYVVDDVASTGTLCGG